MTFKFETWLISGQNKSPSFTFKPKLPFPKLFFFFFFFFPHDSFQCIFFFFFMVNNLYKK